MQIRVLSQNAEAPQRPEYAVANEWPNQRGKGKHHQLLVLALSAWKALGHCMEHSVVGLESQGLDSAPKHRRALSFYKPV